MKSSPRIENQISCLLISIYNPIKEIKKITNTRYFLLTRPKTHKIKNWEPNLLPFYFHSKKLQIYDISFSLVPKPTKLPPRVENQIFCHFISIYNPIKKIKKITNPKPTKSSSRIENQISYHFISIYNPIKEIKKITNIRYFFLTRPKTYEITTKNREPSLLSSYFHSKKLQIHDISSSRYFVSKIDVQKCRQSLSITLLRSNRGKKKKKNSKTGGYNIENIIFPNSILPPFLRTQRRTENLASAENSDFPSDYRTRSV